MRLLGSPRNFPDLPRLWDGGPVEWEAWEKRVATSLDFHVKGAGECEGCGLATSLWKSVGMWKPPGAKHVHSRACATARHRGNCGRIRDFHATRCGWCGHTTVYTMHDGQAWTLDETDYGEHGSYDLESLERLF